MILNQRREKRGTILRKNDLKPLLIAGGTLLFYMCAIPLCDKITEYIASIFNNKITKINYMTAQTTEELEEIANRVNGTQPIKSIGFEIESNEDEVEYNGRKNF